LGLTERARRELLSSDAGREAEIVFDAHAGAGLAARRIRFDHQHVEALRCGIHRRAEARRASADDHHVADVTLINVDRLVEAEAIGDLRVGGVSKYRLTTTDHDRNVRSEEHTSELQSP